MRVYIAAPFALRLLVDYMACELESEGHVITYKWFHAELAMQATPENIGSIRVREIAAAERQGVASADALLVLVAPTGGTGVWIEVGIALASRVPVYAMSARGDGPPPYRSIFDSLCEAQVSSLAEFKGHLVQLKDRADL